MAGTAPLVISKNEQILKVLDILETECFIYLYKHLYFYGPLKISGEEKFNILSYLN